MLGRSTTLTLSATFVLLLGLATSAAAIEEEHSETFALRANGRVSLENVNGNVTIEGWDGAEVKVEYAKRGKTRADLEHTKVELDGDEDHVRIETHYTKSTREWSGDNWSEVEFKLWVPRQARLDGIELVNGDLEVHGIDGSVNVSLINGDVHASELGGDIELETVNGEVDARLTRLAADQTVNLSSVNGSIELRVTAETSADIEAQTVHGGIHTDLPLEVKKGRYVGQSLRGSLGRGGSRIKLQNVNGSIEIRGE